MAKNDWIPVSAGVIFKGGRVLLARKKPGKHLAGYWEFPGGKLEEGETPEACLEREINEELGIAIKHLRFWMECTYRYPQKSILLKVVTARYGGGEIALNDHDAFVWVAKKGLDDYLVAPADVAIVQRLKQSSWDDLC